MGDHPTVYLFVHVILSVQRRETLLGRPVRNILFTHIQKDSEAKGIRVLAVGGVEDHVHCLVQLMPSQNLLQVVESLRTESARWLNENKVLSGVFEWEEGYAAWSVSPSGVKQAVDYIARQEEFHRTKTLDNELEIIERYLL